MSEARFSHMETINEALVTLQDCAVQGQLLSDCIEERVAEIRQGLPLPSDSTSSMLDMLAAFVSPLADGVPPFELSQLVAEWVEDVAADFVLEESF